MLIYADKKQKEKSKLVTNVVSQKKNTDESSFQFVDNRDKAVSQRKQQEMTNNSPQLKQAAQLKEMANSYSAHQQSSIQLFSDSSNEIIQLGGGGGKKKGDDYCNNIGKSLVYLEDILNGFIDANIRGPIAIINANRAKCSVSTSLVSGSDTNTAEYGEFNRTLRGFVDQIGLLIGETDKKYYDKTARKFGRRLHRLFGSIPDVAVDTRVAAVILAGTEGDQGALAAINAALIQLRNALQARILAYLMSIGPYTPKKRPPEDPDEGAGGAGVGGGELVESFA